MMMTYHGVADVREPLHVQMVMRLVQQQLLGAEGGAGIVPDAQV